MNEKINTIFNLLNSLTLLEGKELITLLENNFSIDNTTNTINTPITNTILIQEKEEEKSTFDIILETVPMDKKMNVLKLIRTITGLGLKESKDIMDNVPKTLKTNISKEESLTIKKEFENIGVPILIK